MDLHCMPGEENGLSLAGSERGTSPPSRRLSATGPIPPNAPLRSAGGTDPFITTPAQSHALRSSGGPTSSGLFDGEVLGLEGFSEGFGFAGADGEAEDTAAAVFAMA